MSNLSDHAVAQPAATMGQAMGTLLDALADAIQHAGYDATLRALRTAYPTPREQATLDALELGLALQGTAE